MRRIGAAVFVVISAALAAAACSGDSFEPGGTAGSGALDGGSGKGGSAGGGGAAGTSGSGGSAACEGIDTKTDPANCGACGAACPQAPNAKPVCENGVCGIECNAPFANCNQNVTDGCEVDTSSDASHCGTCKTACDEGPPGGSAFVCEFSQCQCESGRTECSSSFGDACVQVLKDPNFCGQSCTECAVGEACSNGTCAKPTCAYGQTMCGGQCVNLQSNPGHCGSCNKVCNYDESCVQGVCHQKGNLPQFCGLHDECFDNCTDRSVDSENCGNCNTECAAGQACVNGSCQALQLAAEPWQCKAPFVACALPPEWVDKPAPYYCWQSCVFGGSPVN